MQDEATDKRKTLVLTGASRGIGHATVKRFSREVRRQSDRRIQAGSVVATDPPAGAEISREQAVTLIVSFAFSGYDLFGGSIGSTVTVCSELGAGEHVVDGLTYRCG